MENRIVIRNERAEEYREVENLVRESFWDVYRPGCYEHYVLHTMRKAEAFVKELDFVMLEGSRIIGQNCFVRAEIALDGGKRLPIMTMGPICIANDLKRKGYGKYLLDETVKAAAACGCGALCLEGSIDFYGKSGFVHASDFGIRYHGLPEGTDQSFFLAKELIPGYLSGAAGEYSTPECYFVADEEVAEFDAGFPYKEKLKLPGQLFDA